MSKWDENCDDDNDKTSLIPGQCAKILTWNMSLLLMTICYLTF